MITHSAREILWLVKGKYHNILPLRTWTLFVSFIKHLTLCSNIQSLSFLLTKDQSMIIYIYHLFWIGGLITSIWRPSNYILGTKCPCLDTLAGELIYRIIVWIQIAFLIFLTQLVFSVQSSAYWTLVWVLETYEISVDKRGGVWGRLALLTILMALGAFPGEQWTTIRPFHIWRTSRSRKENHGQGFG